MYSVHALPIAADSMDSFHKAPANVNGDKDHNILWACLGCSNSIWLYIMWGT